MRKFVLAAAVAAASITVPAMAQDMTDTTAPAPMETAPVESAPEEAAPVATAPDGTPAFGIEPYFGVMGGWEGFDNERSSKVPLTSRRLDGYLVQGVAGINVPLGPVFVGVEGNAAKGFSGDIDWQYGAAGRFGFRAGDSGMVYGKVGYQWVNFTGIEGVSNRDYGDVTYGAGVEVGPKDIGLGGITGNSGFRLRTEVSTFGSFHSLRPMIGVIAHF